MTFSIKKNFLEDNNNKDTGTLQKFKMRCST